MASIWRKYLCMMIVAPHSALPRPSPACSTIIKIQSQVYKATKLVIRAFAIFIPMNRELLRHRPLSSAIEEQPTVGIAAAQAKGLMRAEFR